MTNSTPYQRNDLDKAGSRDLDHASSFSGPEPTKLLMNVFWVQWRILTLPWQVSHCKSSSTKPWQAFLPRIMAESGGASRAKALIDMKTFCSRDHLQLEDLCWMQAVIFSTTCLTGLLVRFLNAAGAPPVAFKDKMKVRMPIQYILAQYRKNDNYPSS